MIEWSTAAGTKVTITRLHNGEFAFAVIRTEDGLVMSEGELRGPTWPDAFRQACTLAGEPR